MEENFIENLINNLMQDRDLRGNSTKCGLENEIDKEFYILMTG